MKTMIQEKEHICDCRNKVFRMLKETDTVHKKSEQLLITSRKIHPSLEEGKENSRIKSKMLRSTRILQIILPLSLGLCIQFFVFSAKMLTSFSCFHTPSLFCHAKVCTHSVSTTWTCELHVDNDYACWWPSQTHWGFLHMKLTLWQSEPTLPHDTLVFFQTMEPTGGDRRYLCSR